MCVCMCVCMYVCICIYIVTTYMYSDFCHLKLVCLPEICCKNMSVEMYRKYVSKKKDS
jgi:hypothetical protein